MAEVELKCRTCNASGPKNVLLDEWINEDGTITAHLCAKCMAKDENSIFWEDCVCEKCGKKCQIQRHHAISIRALNESGEKVCPVGDNPDHPDCDGKAHLYCQICQMKIAGFSWKTPSGEICTNPETYIRHRMMVDDGIRVNAFLGCSWTEAIIMAAIPVVIGMALIVMKLGE